MTSTEDQDLQISDTNAPMETSTMYTTTSPNMTGQTKSQLNLGVDQIARTQKFSFLYVKRAGGDDSSRVGF